MKASSGSGSSEKRGCRMPPSSTVWSRKRTSWPASSVPHCEPLERMLANGVKPGGGNRQALRNLRLRNLPIYQSSNLPIFQCEDLLQPISQGFRFFHRRLGQQQIVVFDRGLGLREEASSRIVVDALAGIEPVPLDQVEFLFRSTEPIAHLRGGRRLASRGGGPQLRRRSCTWRLRNGYRNRRYCRLRRGCCRCRRWCFRCRGLFCRRDRWPLGNHGRFCNDRGHRIHGDARRRLGDLEGEGLRRPRRARHARASHERQANQKPANHVHRVIYQSPNLPIFQFLLLPQRQEHPEHRAPSFGRLHLDFTAV